MQQLMVGVYLAELCLLGLFAINIGKSAVAVGPVILQVILIIVTVVVHIAMRKKLAPLVARLPLNLLHESEHHQHEEHKLNGKGIDRSDNIRANENDMHPGYEGGKDDILTSGPDGTGLVSGAAAHFTNDRYENQAAKEDIANLYPQPRKRSLLQRLFTPQSQSAAELSASLSPRFREPVHPYDVQDARKAYLHPAIVEEPPVIWLARDPLGVSAQEIIDLREKLVQHGVHVTDEGAIMNEKGKLEWIDESAREAPLWEGKVVY